MAKEPLRDPPRKNIAGFETFETSRRRPAAVQNRPAQAASNASMYAQQAFNPWHKMFGSLYQPSYAAQAQLMGSLANTWGGVRQAGIGALSNVRMAEQARAGGLEQTLAGQYWPTVHQSAIKRLNLQDVLRAFGPLLSGGMGQPAQAQAPPPRRVMGPNLRGS